MQRTKRIARALAAAGLVIVMTAGTAFASYGTGTVTADALRMRSGPSTGTSIVTVLNKGTRVELLSGEENGWYKVSYNGTVGYMSAEWLSVVVSASTGAPADAPSAPAENPPAQSSNETPAQSTEKPAPTVVGSTATVVGAGLLNIRSGPGTDCARIGVLKDGDQVTILEDLDDWYKISMNGMTGFVASKYLSIGGTYEETSRDGLVLSGPLNVRTGPGTGYDRVTSLKAGTAVKVLASSNGWYRISVNNIIGYVHGDYVVLLDDIGSSPVGQAAAAMAMSLVGSRYVYGAEGPNSFDCSGLAYYIFKQLGYTIARGSSGQYKNSGKFVSASEIEPGDLVFFFDPKFDGSGGTLPTTHMGIYVGNGQFVHASTTSYRVQYDNLYGSYYTPYIVGFKRIG